jgi:hypothetical protein
MNLREKIEASSLFNSGEAFRPVDMAKFLNEDTKSVGSTISDMRDKCQVAYDGRLYWKPRVHWIHKARLDDPLTLEEKRIEASQ